MEIVLLNLEDNPLDSKKREYFQIFGPQWRVQCVVWGERVANAFSTGLKVKTDEVVEK